VRAAQVDHVVHAVWLSDVENVPAGHALQV
jgi:hypothetical protein